MSPRPTPTMRQLSALVYIIVGLAAIVVTWAVWRVSVVNGPSPTAFGLASTAAPIGLPAGDRPKHGLIGALAPDFSLPLLDTGKTVTLSSLQGQPVILDFFASWCPSCRAEAPRLQEFWKAYEETGLTLLGVALNDHVEGLRDLKDEFLLSYPMGLDETGEIAALYRVGSIPTFVLIDREGRVANVVVGTMSEATMTAAADALIR